MELNGQDNQQPSKPNQVTLAIYLIYASLALTILHTLINPAAVGQAETETAPSLFLYLTFAFVILFPIFLAIKIAAGRNWARQLYSVGVFLNFFYVANLLQTFDDHPLITTLGTIPLLFQIMAIVLLFQGPANAWFRSIKTAARSQSDPDGKTVPEKENRPAPEESAGSRAYEIPQLKYVAIAAAAGAAVGLMNGLFWASTFPPQSDSEQQFITFLILGGLLLGGILGAVSGFLFLQFARQNPNRTPALWAAMGGILGGVFSLGCCFLITALSFV